jgi:hypothetical protein
LYSDACSTYALGLYDDDDDDDDDKLTLDAVCETYLNVGFSPCDNMELVDKQNFSRN